MQLNICEGEGGRAASDRGGDPVTAAPPTPTVLVSVASPTSLGPAFQSTGGCFCTSVFKPHLEGDATEVRKEKHQRPLSCVSGKSASGIFQPFCERIESSFPSADTSDSTDKGAPELVTNQKQPESAHSTLPHRTSD